MTQQNVNLDNWIRVALAKEPTADCRVMSNTSWDDHTLWSKLLLPLLYGETALVEPHSVLCVGVSGAGLLKLERHEVRRPPPSVHVRPIGSFRARDASGASWSARHLFAGLEFGAVGSLRLDWKLSSKKWHLHTMVEYIIVGAGVLIIHRCRQYYHSHGSYTDFKMQMGARERCGQVGHLFCQVPVPEAGELVELDSMTFDLGGSVFRQAPVTTVNSVCTNSGSS